MNKVVLFLVGAVVALVLIFGLKLPNMVVQRQTAANPPPTLNIEQVTDATGVSHPLPYNTCGTSDDPAINSISISGSGDGWTPPGQIDALGVAVDWGDGTVTIPDITGTSVPGYGVFNPNTGQGHFDATFDSLVDSGVSVPPHTYTSNGQFTISVILYHQNINGQDNTVTGTNTITVCVELNAPPTISISPSSSATIAENILYDNTSSNATYITAADDDIGQAIDPFDPPHLLLQPDAPSGMTLEPDPLDPGNLSKAYLKWPTPVLGTYTFTIRADDGKLHTDETMTVEVVTSHTITASAGSNGSISPSGSVAVADGGDQSFSITANSGYHVLDVLVDSVSVGAVSSYDFNNVTTNHTISATFAADPTYTITASSGANGSISPPGVTTITSGGSQGYTITANSGYHVLDVLVDAVSVGAVSSYTFSNVTANHTISVTFAVNTVLTHTITSSTGSGGTILPLGVVTVNEGSSQGFTITANSGYHTLDVLVDSSSIGAANSYNFTNVITNHTISATFEVNPVVNVAPVATNSDFSIIKNVNKDITLKATDGNDDTLTFSIVGAPQHGTIGVVNGNQVTYTPTHDYVGTDTFTFKANDGSLDSNVATISIAIETPSSSTVSGSWTCTDKTASNFGKILPCQYGNAPTITSTGGSSCSIYLDTFLRSGYKNDANAVVKLQTFLNNYLHENIPTIGIYGPKTETAVRNFQLLHSDAVLKPWDELNSTGITYLTTVTEINNILCPSLNLPIPSNLIPWSDNPETTKTLQ